MRIGVLYIGDFKAGEESLLQGWTSVRAGSVEELSPDLLRVADRWVLRARRLSLGEFCKILASVQDSGGSLASSELSYAMISSLRTLRVALAEFGPRMVVCRGDESPEKVCRAAEEAQLRTPLFVRSEIESAAKYVGLEGCTVPSLSSENVAKPLQSLREYVPNHQEVALKEMWEIKRLGSTDIAMEYRTIGYRGRLVAVDFQKGNLLPRLEPWHVDFLNRAYGAVAELGCDGVHVLDIGIRAVDRIPFIVEWKDFSSSSLKNPQASIGAVIEAIAANGS